ncbi:MAG: phosphate acyltransferase, partial [Acetobacteraceae bacterium]
RFIEVVACLEPTFGAINLEDIKAPECFRIEAALRSRMRIPVFHDDQHGTAITVAAAIRNGLMLQEKRLEDVRLVTSGAGAAALACVDLLVAMGLKAENVTLSDIKGVVYAGRPGLAAENLTRYARETKARRLDEVLDGADVFLGLSAPGVLQAEWLGRFAPRPLILALANPDPEIMPELVHRARPDAIMATGRSDYPNQVNNVLCFPFIFRGALDVAASAIDQGMQIAAVEALAGLARKEASEVVLAAYGGAAPVFGPDYIIPKPFDPRLILEIAPAVAKAAMQSGVARRPLADPEAYHQELERFAFRSGALMHPVFDAARHAPKRIAYAEGEDERVLRAVQTVLDEGIAVPLLVGRRAAIAERIHDLGLRLRPGENVEIFDPAHDTGILDALLPRYRLLVSRRGIPPLDAKRRLTHINTVAAAMLLNDGRVDAAICGGTGEWWRHMQQALPLVPRLPGTTRVYALSVLILNSGTLFFCDTQMVPDPTAAQIAEMTVLAAAMVRSFGIVPKAALLSHSSFGGSRWDSARKMRTALELIRTHAPALEIDGEMQGDAALSEAIRDRVVANSKLSGIANLLVMPNLDAANIAFNLLKAAAEGLTIGPLLLGLAKPLNVMVPSATARGIVNVSALSVRAVQEREKEAVAA